MTPTSNLQEEKIYVLCSQDGGIQCGCKITEIMLSLLLLIWAIIEGSYHVQRIRTTMECFITIFLIAITLLINISYSIWGEIYTLFILETLFYNFYFISLVVYILKKYLKKSEKTYSRNRKFVIIGVCLHILIFLGLFVDEFISINSKGSKCQTVWNLIINTECILLCLIACIILFLNHLQQSKKITTYLQSSFYFDKSKINNPLKWVWSWIGLNIMSQIINMIQNGLFLQAIPENGCKILNLSSSNSVLKLIFTIGDLYLGFVGTLLYYAWVRYRYKKYLTDDGKFESSEQFQYESSLSANHNFQILLTSNRFNENT